MNIKEKKSPLNIDFGIINERQDNVRGVPIGVGRVNEGDEGKRIWLNWLHIHIQNKTMKPLAIALSGAGRGLQGGDGKGDLTNVHCKAIRNCQNECPPVQRIHPNKNWENF
jgi:hypothetical protein